MSEQISELSPTPAQGRKSFYGKAHVIKDGKWTYLKSYETVVCGYDEDTKSFHRFWKGNTQTTMRHIQAFRNYVGLEPLKPGKWNYLPVEEKN